MIAQLAGKIALITGASRGIGAAVATYFASEGAHVILVARTVGGLEAVDDVIQQKGGKATLVVMDLSKEHDKIDMLGAQIAERFGRLDIVVGNAASLGDITPLTHAEPSMWQRVMEVNVTANWRLIRSLDPLLQRSEAGRAIFVTSGLARHPRAYWGPYAVSKAALEVLIQTYAAEIANTSVRANLLDPAVVRTKMRASAMPGEDPLTLPEPHTLMPYFLELALPSCTRNGATLKVPR